MEDNLYTLLGVESTATPEEITIAYRKLAMKHHPDRAGDSQEAADMMAKINAAYDILNNDIKRAEYDATGQTSSADKMGSIVKTALDMLNETITSCPDTDTIDLVQVMIGKIDRNIFDLIQSNNQNRGVIQKFNKIKNRFKKKHGCSGENLFTKTIEKRIADCEMFIRMNEEREQFLRQLLEYVRTYEFEVNAPTVVVMTSTNGMYRISTSSTTSM
jgi:curved DNA-binding protein CbpA